MSEPLEYLLTAPNEPMARFWEQVLGEAGIPVLLKTGGPGVGGWGSAAMFAHDLYVRAGDLERARAIVAEDADEDEETEEP